MEDTQRLERMERMKSDGCKITGVGLRSKSHEVWLMNGSSHLKAEWALRTGQDWVERLNWGEPPNQYVPVWIIGR